MLGWFRTREIDKLYFRIQAQDDSIQFLNNRLIDVEKKLNDQRRIKEMSGQITIPTKVTRGLIPIIRAKPRKPSRKKKARKGWR